MSVPHSRAHRCSFDAEQINSLRELTEADERHIGERTALPTYLESGRRKKEDVLTVCLLFPCYQTVM
jgi:hypothetical protein